MAQIPNVTERIAELREFKKAKSLSHPLLATPPTFPKSTTEASDYQNLQPERRIATSYWVLAIYSVLFAALMAQLLLIALLDIL